MLLGMRRTKLLKNHQRMHALVKCQTDRNGHGQVMRHGIRQKLTGRKIQTSIPAINEMMKGRGRCMSIKQVCVQYLACCASDCFAGLSSMHEFFLNRKCHVMICIRPRFEFQRVSQYRTVCVTTLWSGLRCVSCRCWNTCSCVSMLCVQMDSSSCTMIAVCIGSWWITKTRVIVFTLHSHVTIAYVVHTSSKVKVLHLGSQYFSTDSGVAFCACDQCSWASGTVYSFSYVSDS